MKSARIALVVLSAALLILHSPVFYLAIRKFGLKGYWSHNPYEALPPWALPWFRAAAIVLITGYAVGIIFYS